MNKDFNLDQLDDITTLSYLDATGKKNHFYIDFADDTFIYRLKKASLRKELLARALGAKPKDKMKILDATAGLGRDAFLLAWLGYELSIAERSDTIYLLLADGLKRAAMHPLLKTACARIHLYHADAIDLTQTANAKFDIIYLDPMFPLRKKKALVKKEMIILQTIIKNDADTGQLFAQALACAAYRVVVKRPRLAAFLAEKQPDFSLTGRSSRFDVYLAK